METIACRGRRHRWATALLLALCLASVPLAWGADPQPCSGQSQSTPVSTASVQTSPAEQSPDPDAQPLPEIASLMREVEAHQQQSERLLKDYIYRSVETAEENDKSGGVKKRTVREFNVFWLSGVPVRKLIAKDGKPLSPDELKKEDERIDKEVREARQRREKNESKGRQTDPRGNEEVTVSRLLELGSFSHPRREMLAGRPTIAVDYTGDPKAKTRNRMESVIRDLVGTVWVDEHDRAIAKLQGRFLDSFKIGGGLLVNIRKDTSFGMEQRKINEEVWLPTAIEGHGAARVMLVFNFDGSVRVLDTDFRKFKASSRVLEGLSTVEDPK